MSRGVLATLALTILLIPISLISFVLLIYLTPLAIVVIVGWKVFEGLIEVRQADKHITTYWWETTDQGANQ